MARILNIVCAGLLMTLAVSGGALPEGRSGEHGSDKAGQWLHKENLSPTRTVTEAFVNNHIIVEGEGFPSRGAATAGQKRLTALRAAEIAAYRRLAEFVDGVAVTGDTTTRDLALELDTVRIAVTGFVHGAQMIYREYDGREETARVLLKTGMTGPGSYGEMVYTRLMKDGKVAVDPENRSRTPFTAPESAATDTGYDGLVIDATGQAFRPALVNRIFTLKGEVLYDPSKVEGSLLADHGCGSYARDVEKAKAALKMRGVANPLVIKAAGTLNPSDLKVGDGGRGKDLLRRPEGRIPGQWKGRLCSEIGPVFVTCPLVVVDYRPSHPLRSIFRGGIPYRLPQTSLSSPIIVMVRLPYPVFSLNSPKIHPVPGSAGRASSPRTRCRAPRAGRSRRA